MSSDESPQTKWVSDEKGLGRTGSGRTGYRTNRGFVEQQQPEPTEGSTYEGEDFEDYEGFEGLEVDQRIEVLAFMRARAASSPPEMETQACSSVRREAVDRLTLDPEQVGETEQVRRRRRA